MRCPFQQVTTRNVQMWLVAQIKAYDMQIKERKLFCGTFPPLQTIFNNFDVYSSCHQHARYRLGGKLQLWRYAIAISARLHHSYDCNPRHIWIVSTCFVFLFSWRKNAYHKRHCLLVTFICMTFHKCRLMQADAGGGYFLSLTKRISLSLRPKHLCIYQLAQ